MRRPLALLAFVVLLSPLAGARADDEAPRPASAEHHVVAAADLVPGFEREGRLEADEPARVVLRFEVYAGPFVALEVDPALRDGGKVEAGAVLARLDPTELDRALRGAREAAAVASETVTRAEVEDALDAAQEATALEQAVAAARDATEALARFDAHDGPAMLAASALQLEQGEAGLSDQKEELAQLEQIYSGTQLASETKEIVLERARRGVRLAEAGLVQQRARHKELVDHDHPAARRALDERLRWSQVALVQARERQPIGAARRKEALETARRALRDAREQVARLEADRGHLTVTSPAAGLVDGTGLRPGDPVSPGVLAKVVDPTRLIVRFEASEEDLRLLEPGRAVTLLVPALAEVALKGKVRHVAAAASDGAQGPQVAVVVAVDGTHPLARPGLRCLVSGQGDPLRHVLVIPRRAVKVENGRTTCGVFSGGPTQRVEVVLGAGNRENVRVVRGLVAGDEVVLE